MAFNFINGLKIDESVKNSIIFKINNAGNKVKRQALNQYRPTGKDSLQNREK